MNKQNINWIKKSHACWGFLKEKTGVKLISPFQFIIHLIIFSKTKIIFGSKSIFPLIDYQLQYMEMLLASYSLTYFSLKQLFLFLLFLCHFGGKNTIYLFSLRGRCTKQLHGYETCPLIQKVKSHIGEVELQTGANRGLWVILAVAAGQKYAAVKLRFNLRFVTRISFEQLNWKKETVTVHTQTKQGTGNPA